MTVEKGVFHEKEVIPHTLRLFRKPTGEYEGRIMIRIDDKPSRGSNEMKARIIRALVFGPIDRKIYLELVVGKPYGEISRWDKRVVSQEQQALKQSAFHLDFPDARNFEPSMRYSGIYQLPSGMTVIFESGVLPIEPNSNRGG